MATTGDTPKRADVLDLLAQVGAAGHDLVGVLREHLGGQRLPGDDVVPSAVRLERAHGGDERRRRPAPARTPGTSR